MTAFAPHFPLSELTVTDSGLPNVPSAAYSAQLAATSWLLEEIRGHLGGHPIRVTSGYRSEAVNREAHGSPTSDHRRGRAADWRHSTLSGEECMAILAPLVASGALVVDQLIVYAGGMIHASRRPSGNRGEVLRSMARSGSSGPYVPWREM